MNSEIKIIGGVFVACILTLVILAGIVSRGQKRDLANPRVVIVYGCEYLRMDTYYGYPTLTHKGNCKNH